MKAKTNNISFEQKVNDIVTKKIHPLLQQHNGGIRVKEIKDGNVWVVFEGACKTCPSAQFTIEEVVTEVLKAELKDELKEVFLVTETDQELLDFAKKILNNNKK